MDLINLDKTENLQKNNLSSNKEILNSSYNLISSLIKNNPKNFITYLKYQKFYQKIHITSNSDINSSKKIQINMKVKN